MKIEYVLAGVIVVLVGVGVTVILKDDGEGKEAAATGSNAPQNVMPFVEIENPAGFVNTNDQPIKIADYVGKQVILLDIMTYSCINCQRSFPYVTKWYETYKDDGLIVIGIHTPEFAFEKDKGNVEKAMKEFGITFPVVLDNDYATWNALGNKYWPRKYLIDIHGNIVYDHIGEGAYEETEEKIKELLKERAAVLGMQETFEEGLTARGIAETKTSADSPETYFGSLRNEYIGNGSMGKEGVQSFVFPGSIEKNRIYFGGTWNIKGEFAQAQDAATLHYKYMAKEVYIVAESETGGTIEVLQDGATVSTAGGVDVSQGKVEVNDSRLYKLIRNESSGEHMLELRVTPGVKLFAFTFG